MKFCFNFACFFFECTNYIEYRLESLIEDATRLFSYSLIFYFLQPCIHDCIYSMTWNSSVQLAKLTTKFRLDTFILIALVFYVLKTKTRHCVQL